MDVAQPLELRPLPSEGLLGQTASGAGSTDTREVACLSGPIVLTEEREAAASSSKRNIDEYVVSFLAFYPASMIAAEAGLS